MATWRTLEVLWYFFFHPKKQWHKSNHAYLLETLYTISYNMCAASPFVHEDAFKDLF